LANRHRSTDTCQAKLPYRQQQLIVTLPGEARHYVSAVHSIQIRDLRAICCYCHFWVVIRQSGSYRVPPRSRGTPCAVATSYRRRRSPPWPRKTHSGLAAQSTCWHSQTEPVSQRKSVQVPCVVTGICPTRLGNRPAASGDMKRCVVLAADDSATGWFAGHPRVEVSPSCNDERSSPPSGMSAHGR